MVIQHHHEIQLDIGQAEGTQEFGGWFLDAGGNRLGAQDHLECQKTGHHDKAARGRKASPAGWYGLQLGHDSGSGHDRHWVLYTAGGTGDNRYIALSAQPDGFRCGAANDKIKGLALLS